MNTRPFALATPAWFAISPLAAHAEADTKSAESLVASKRAADMPIGS